MYAVQGLFLLDDGSNDIDGLDNRMMNEELNANNSSTPLLEQDLKKAHTVYNSMNEDPNVKGLWDLANPDKTLHKRLHFIIKNKSDVGTVLAKLKNIVDNTIKKEVANV